jgi:hypothetical protein
MRDDVEENVRFMGDPGEQPGPQSFHALVDRVHPRIGNEHRGTLIIGRHR